MLSDPLRHIGHGAHDTLLWRRHFGELQMLILALLGLRNGADRDDQLNEAHNGSSGWPRAYDYKRPYCHRVSRWRQYLAFSARRHVALQTSQRPSENRRENRAVGV